MTARMRSSWTIVVPILAAIALIATWQRTLPLVVVILVGVVLIAAVLAAVHHA